MNLTSTAESLPQSRPAPRPPHSNSFLLRSPQSREKFPTNSCPGNGISKLGLEKLPSCSILGGDSNSGHSVAIEKAYRTPTPRVRCQHRLGIMAGGTAMGRPAPSGLAKTLKPSGGQAVQSGSHSESGAGSVACCSRLLGHRAMR